MEKEKEVLGYCGKCKTMQLFPISGINHNKCPLCEKTYFKKRNKKFIKEKTENIQLGLFDKKILQNSG